jgi:hypothetical protein
MNGDRKAFVSDLPPDDQAELVQLLPVLLQGRQTQEAVLLQQCYLGNQTDAEVAKECGLPAETVSKKRNALKTDYYALRDLRQPPHAAD